MCAGDWTSNVNTVQWERPQIPRRDKFLSPENLVNTPRLRKNELKPKQFAHGNFLICNTRQIKVHVDIAQLCPIMIPTIWERNGETGGPLNRRVKRGVKSRRHSASMWCQRALTFLSEFRTSNCNRHVTWYQTPRSMHQPTPLSLFRLLVFRLCMFN